MGEWNVINDKNTLIDPGSDPGIFEKIRAVNTGLGKNKVDQIILTHTHSDHAALAEEAKRIYNAEVYAFGNNLKCIDKHLDDGQRILIGDCIFEIFHITSHSYDSICLVCETEQILFAGDTTFPIKFENEKLEHENFDPVFRLRKKSIKYMYPGHGEMKVYNDKKRFIVSQK
jgi:glyoxylase-like metal-dependent hydrolase (beta-lactamase superfamily II)